MVPEPLTLPGRPEKGGGVMSGLNDGHRAMVGVVLAVATLVGWACSEESAPPDEQPASPAAADEALIAFLHDEFGMSIRIVSSERSMVDGAIELRERLEVTVDGHGSRMLGLDETVYPDDLTIVILTDEETGEGRYFAWHVADAFIVMGTNNLSGENTNLEIVPLDDARFGVGTFADGSFTGADDVQPVGDGRATFDVIEQQVGYTDIPPHVLMTAFALAHTPAPEARLSASCGNTAAAPTVCALFEDFCNCAPCLVLDDPAICQKWCPAP